MTLLIVMTNTDKLEIMRLKIEAMPQQNQIEILKIISGHKEIILNENKNGIHINLTEITPSVINEMSEYINYISSQELNLSVMETQKEEFKNTFFPKESTKR